MKNQENKLKSDISVVHYATATNFIFDHKKKK